MKSLFFTFILLISSILVGIRCSNLPFQHDGGGGGTETVIGNLIYNDGHKASQAQVYLIPEDYNPVTDDPIDSTLITQTDSEGRYVFSKIPAGNYNTLAHDKITDKCNFHSNISVPKQDTFFLNDTLKSPGSINFMMLDTFNTNGYVFIRGTNIYKSVKKDSKKNNNYRSFMFKGIPPETFNTFEYTLRDRNFKPVTLHKSFKVEPQDTVLVQGYKVFIVRGVVEYQNGVYASDALISIFPETHIPLKDNDNGFCTSMSAVTDSKGEFFLKLPSKGIYNIQGIHPAYNKHFFRSDIIVDQDTTVLNPSILQKPGQIKILLPDSLERNNGYVFIKGTNVYAKLMNSTRLKDGFYSLLIDSIPEGTYRTLYYRRSKKKEDPIDLKTGKFTITSNTSITLEAFETGYVY